MISNHGYKLVQDVYLVGNFEGKKRVNEKIKSFYTKWKKLNKTSMKMVKSLVRVSIANIMFTSLFLAQKG